MQSFGGDGGIEHSCVVSLSLDVFFFFPAKIDRELQNQQKNTKKMQQSDSPRKKVNFF